MKLTRIPGIEPSVKQSLTFKQSTLDLLNEYLEVCSEQSGTKVSFRYMVEQMLLDFMAEDKEFLKLSKERKTGAGKRGNKAQVAQENPPAEKASAASESASQVNSSTTVASASSGSTPASSPASAAAPSLLDRFKGA